MLAGTRAPGAKAGGVQYSRRYAWYRASTEAAAVDRPLPAAVPAICEGGRGEETREAG